MKKLNNSNFELIQDVIKSLEFNYNPNHNSTLETLNCYWEETIGKKIAKLSKVYEYSDDNVLTVTCADSYISNELYFEKVKILGKMNEKAQEMGIKIKEIKFDYKKWKESNNE